MSYMHTYANKKKSLIFLSAISSSDPGAIRTLDPQLRRLLLYPTELRDHPYIASPWGQSPKANAKLVIFDGYSKFISKFFAVQ